MYTLGRIGRHIGLFGNITALILAPLMKIQGLGWEEISSAA